MQKVYVRNVWLDYKIKDVCQTSSYIYEKNITTWCNYVSKYSATWQGDIPVKIVMRHR